MLTKLKRRFTEWYVHRGYTFWVDGIDNAHWGCPWYVKPLLVFFSPAVYMEKEVGKSIIDNLYAGAEGYGKYVAEHFDKTVIDNAVRNWLKKEVNSDVL